MRLSRSVRHFHAPRQLPAPTLKFSIPDSPKLLVLEKLIQENHAKVRESEKATDKSTWMKNLRIHLGHTSNALEGNTLSQADIVSYVERGITLGSGKQMKDIEDVMHHDRALNLMFRLAAGEMKWTPDIVKDLHRLALPHPSDPDSDAVPGVFKTKPNAAYTVLPNGEVCLRVYILPRDVEPSLEQVMLWGDKNEAKISPLRFATLMHYNIVSIHPFGDTNGRTARLAMNLALLRRGFNPCVIAPEAKAQYLEGLMQAQL